MSDKAITDRNLTDEALRDRDAWLNAIYQNSPVGIVCADPHGRRIDANPAYLRIIGYDLAEVLAAPLGSYTHADFVAAETSLLRKLADGCESTLHMETKWVRKDGCTIWISLSAQLVRDAKGQPRFYFGMVDDITERKRAEEARSAAERHLRSVISATPIVLWEVDRAGTILLSEGNALSTLGLRPGELVGHSVMAYDQNDPHALADILRGLTGEEFSREVHVRGLDWTNHYIPIRDDKGSVVGLIGISMDITPRKQAEEALRAVNGQLTSVVESTGDVIAMMDREYCYTFFNTACRDEFQRIFGLTLRKGDSMVSSHLSGGQP